MPYNGSCVDARIGYAALTALSIVYRTIAGFQVRKAGLRRRAAGSGAVTDPALWQVR
jgi:hypothetical protein